MKGQGVVQNMDLEINDKVAIINRLSTYYEKIGRITKIYDVGVDVYFFDKKEGFYFYFSELKKI